MAIALYRRKVLILTTLPSICLYFCFQNFYFVNRVRTLASACLKTVQCNVLAPGVNLAKVRETKEDDFRMTYLSNA